MVELEAQVWTMLTPLIETDFCEAGCGQKILGFCQPVPHREYIILYYIIYYIIFYYITLYYIILHYITLYYITLYYVILYYIMLYYIILYKYFIITL